MKIEKQRQTQKNKYNKGECELTKSTSHKNKNTKAKFMRVLDKNQGYHFQNLKM